MCGVIVCVCVLVTAPACSTGLSAYHSLLGCALRGILSVLSALTLHQIKTHQQLKMCSEQIISARSYQSLKPTTLV